jgi:hypothetical protein
MVAAMEQPADKAVDVEEAEQPPEPQPAETVSEGAPVEIHPPHAPIHSFKDFLIQLLTITTGVLIALSLEGLLEWNHHRQLVREARATLAREIADNKSALEVHLGGSDERMQDANVSLKLVNELLRDKKSDIREFRLAFHLPTLSAAAWQSADRTGAITYMEYSVVQDYARLLRRAGSRRRETPWIDRSNRGSDRDA